jgi:hypothetical protein
MNRRDRRRAATRILPLATALAAILTALLPWTRAVAAAPDPPRETVRVDLPQGSGSGRAIRVRDGDDLQEALDAAHPGDTLLLEPGAVFRGTFTIPNRSGDGWITVQSAAPRGALPAPGTRVTPDDAGSMAVLEAADGAVVVAAPGAHHVRFIGLEIRAAAGSFLYNLVQLGARETRAEDTPHHLIFDRCYIHGDARLGARRGIALNSRHTAVLDSWLSDFREAGADSQALCGWNGPGPFLIAGNTLEAAGENVMFGGEAPTIPGLVPSDITVERNLFRKPLQWKQDDSGKAWTIKNLFELKNARRVLVSGNVLENSWAQAQKGFAVVLTPRDEQGKASWAVVEDVTFTGNVVRGAGGGVNILGRDDSHPGSRAGARRVLISNNLFQDIGGPRWGGRGTLFQVLAGAGDIRIEHNTGLQSGSVVMAEGGPFPGFVLCDNVVQHLAGGIDGSGTGTGLPTLQAMFPGALVRGNVFVGGDPERYPKGNAFPRTLKDVGFVDFPDGNYALAANSRLIRAASDGGTPGADFETLAKTEGAAAARAGGRAGAGRQ